jgi:hypothetical protein
MLNNMISNYLYFICLFLGINALVSNQDFPTKNKKNENWQSLFDGKSLKGWKTVMGDAEFKIDNREIVGIAKFGTSNTFLVTEQSYDDFILEFELKINHISSNSGVMIRGQLDEIAREGKGLVYGYQIEADPTERAWSGGLYDEARRGWIYPLDLNPEAKVRLISVFTWVWLTLRILFSTGSSIVTILTSDRFKSPNTV